MSHETQRSENVFANRNFRLVFLGALVSSMGALLYNFAVSFYILEISGNSAFLQGLYLALCGIAMLLWIAPAALICLIVNLLEFLDERRAPEQRRIIGLRWLWIPVSFLGTPAVKWLYLWLIVAAILWPDRFPV